MVPLERSGHCRHRAVRRLGECVVSRREHRERSWTFQSLHEASGLHRGNQRGVVFGIDGICTMFLEGYIGAPPTIVVISPAADGTGPATTPARRIAEMRFIVRFDLS